MQLKNDHASLLDTDSRHQAAYTFGRQKENCELMHRTGRKGRKSHKVQCAALIDAPPSATYGLSQGRADHAECLDAGKSSHPGVAETGAMK